MAALEKLRDQIAIARAAGHFVVLTPDEAQAIVDERDPARVVYSPCDRHIGFTWSMRIGIAPAVRKVCPICDPPQTLIAIAAPHEGDGKHA